MYGISVDNGFRNNLVLKPRNAYLSSKWHAKEI